jgi:hypothetical protein
MSATHTLRNHRRKRNAMTNLCDAIISERRAAGFSTARLCVHEAQNTFPEHHPRPKRWTDRVRAGDRRSAILSGDSQGGKGAANADHINAVKGASTRDQASEAMDAGALHNAIAPVRRGFTNAQIRRVVTSYQAVGCNQQNNAGWLAIEVPLDPTLEESIVGATAAFADADNVEAVLEPTVLAITGNKALVRYRIRALDANRSCRGSSYILIVVQFVINQRIPSPEAVL